MPIKKKTRRPEKFRAGIYRAGDLIRTTDLAPEEPILTLTDNRSEEGQIVCVQDMVELFASRGIGKSMFAMGLSIAIATGGDFLCWTAVKPRKVLYIDGEMPGRRIQKRLQYMTTGMNEHRRRKLDNNLAFIARDWQGGKRMPRLDTPEGEHAVENLIKHDTWTDEDDAFLAAHLEGPQPLGQWGAQFVIIDNAACLLDPEGENDVKAWAAAHEWLLSLRDKNVTSLLVHHANRAGGARGHSSKEDAMDTVIQLSRPQGYKMSEGAKFKVEFTKGRSLYGEGAEPFMGQLRRNMPLGESPWAWEPLGKKKKLLEGMTALHEAVLKYIRRQPGSSASKIERMVSGSASKVRKAVSDLMKTGQLQKDTNDRFSLVENRPTRLE